MANKKAHITTEAELLKAMRSTGYCFPTNAFEQKMSLKLRSDIDIQALAKEIDPTQIWETENPKEYKAGVIRNIEVDPTFSEQWGIAARGSAEISKEVMDKIRANQKNGDKK